MKNTTELLQKPYSSNLNCSVKVSFFYKYCPKPILDITVLYLCRKRACAKPCQPCVTKHIEQRPFVVWSGSIITFL